MGVWNLDPLNGDEEKGMLCMSLEVIDQFLDIFSVKPPSINGALSGLLLSTQVEFKQSLQIWWVIRMGALKQEAQTPS